MANTATITVSLVYSGNNVAFTKALTAFADTVTGANSIQGEFVTSTADTAIPLGPVSGTLGWAFFMNRDVTNTISIKTAVSGTIIISLAPGRGCLVYLGSGVTAPSCVAGAATPLLEYAILPA